MKQLITFLFLSSMLLACKQKDNIEGIWIPEKINWEDGNFDTFYFNTDSSFIIISSTQKYIDDSIYFEAEPGYVVRKGCVIQRKANTCIIRTEIVYQFIELPMQLKSQKQIILDINNNQIKSFDYKGIKYVRNKKYTSNSVNDIVRIANYYKSVKVKCK